VDSKKLVLSSCFLISLVFNSLVAQEQPFYKEGSYISEIPTPEKIVGFPSGSRPVRHHEAIQYLKTLAEISPCVLFFESGKTHEGRLLCYLIISSEENISKLESIKGNITKLSDPRKLNSPSSIVENTPAIAWMMYSIHGDEISGSDASLQLAYQLAAGEDAKTQKILDEVIVGIDPMENPDGRERYLAQMQQWGGDILNSDVQSIQHSGVWPWGRGNHYLFDLNRDWFILAHPESRARVTALSEWNPQMVVDAHEMGSYDTYLFNPPREPINPNIHQKIRNWWQVFSKDQANAFDEYGWSYYTREWYDEWYPGYGSSWATYAGGVALLYEQASTDGSMVKQPSGKLSTFRDAVHHQFVSSLANLTTVAENRKALMNDFYTTRKQASLKRGAFYLVPGKNPTRAARLVERLLMQNIEVEVAEQNFRVSAVTPGGARSTKSLPKGTYIVRVGQPLGNLVNATLEFDPRMRNEVLQKEREDLEKGKGTHLYEVTSWSLPMAYDIEAYHSASSPSVKTKRIETLDLPVGKFSRVEQTTAYVCEYNDDRALHALLAMFDKGMKVRSAKESFEISGRKFDRGTLLLRVNENSEKVADELAEISNEHRVEIIGLQTLRSYKGPDLGGGEFNLLQKPKIAVLTGPDLSAYSIGAIWYLLDYEMKQRFTLLNHDFFSNFDLRKYNVLVLPSGNSATYKNILGKNGIKKIKTWVNDGGTLIGIGGGAAFLADSSTGLSQVKLRSQALKDLQAFQEAVVKESSWRTKIDSVAIWEGKVSPKASKKKASGPDVKALKELDARQRLFQPRGAIMKVNLEEEHWLNFGLGKYVPVIMYTSTALLSKKPVQTAGRFSKASKLRLSGLLWPEAKQRWAETAYVTRESLGNGQIILFAHEPNFRSYFYGTTRILLNSMLLGPGMGARKPVDW